MEQADIYVAAVEHYGQTNQMVKAMEECGELIQALSKFITQTGNRAQLGRNVEEEIADVQIMLFQLGVIFNHASIMTEIAKKTERLESKIKLSPYQKKKTVKQKKK